jgi:hypothetical protein
MLLLAVLLAVQVVSSPTRQSGAIIRDVDNVVGEGTSILNENVRARADRCERSIASPSQALSDECQMFLEGFNRGARTRMEAR